MWPLAQIALINYSRCFWGVVSSLPPRAPFFPGRLCGAECCQLAVYPAAREVRWLPDIPVLTGGKQPVFPGRLGGAQAMPWAFAFQLAERDAITAAQDQVGKPDQVTASLVVMGIVDVNRGNAVVLASAGDLGEELCFGHLPDAGL